MSQSQSQSKSKSSSKKKSSATPINATAARVVTRALVLALGDAGAAVRNVTQINYHKSTRFVLTVQRDAKVEAALLADGAALGEAVTAMSNELVANGGAVTTFELSAEAAVRLAQGGEAGDAAAVLEAAGVDAAAVTSASFYQRQPKPDADSQLTFMVVDGQVFQYQEAELETDLSALPSLSLQTKVKKKKIEFTVNHGEAGGKSEGKSQGKAQAKNKNKKKGKKKGKNQGSQPVGLGPHLETPERFVESLVSDTLGAAGASLSPAAHRELLKTLTARMTSYSNARYSQGFVAADNQWPLHRSPF